MTTKKGTPKAAQVRPKLKHYKDENDDYWYIVAPAKCVLVKAHPDWKEGDRYKTVACFTVEEADK